MPEERTDPTGRAPDGLRVGPWLGEDVPDTSAVEAAKTGPSWTAPTAELNISATGTARVRRVGIRPGGGAGSGTPRGGRSRPTVRPGTDDRQGIANRLRGYGWLVVSGGLALVVLLGTRFLVPSPPPDWLTATTATTDSATPLDSTIPAATSPKPATSGPAARPTPTPTANSSPRLDATRPPRTPAAPTRTYGLAPAPVLLGPGSGEELWSMLNRYCAEVHDIRQAQLRSGTSPAEGNWECRRHHRSVSINMTEVCRYTYGSGASARYSDGDNAFSWRCYRRP